MEFGKKICNQLKALRQRIANANDIEYNPTECTHIGNCAGTCPKCEQEVEYIERKIEERKVAGLPVNLQGIAKDEKFDAITTDMDFDDDSCLFGEMPSQTVSFVCVDGDIEARRLE